MQRRSLGRLDRALAALSAAICVPRRRIGFLIMPSTAATTDMVSRRRLAKPKLRPAGGACVRYFRRNQDWAGEDAVNSAAPRLLDWRQAFHFKYQSDCAFLCVLKAVRALARRCGGLLFVHG